MDIRSWLNGPKGVKAPFKNTKKAKKDRKCLDSDSDEELEKENPKVTPKKSTPPVKKEMTPGDFFGKSSKKSIPENIKKRKAQDDPVEQVSTPVKKAKKLPTPRVTEDNPKSLTPEKPKKAKPVLDDTEVMDTSVTTTPAEKKKFNYMKYKAKIDSGPKNPGSKDIPVGAENCLEGLIFVITGQGDSLGRDETKALVERYGGKVTSAVSGRTTYLIVGDEPGESKINKAKDKKVQMVDEDFVLNLIKTKPGKRSKYEIQAEEESLKEEARTPKKTPKKQPKKVKEEIPQSASDKKPTKASESPKKLTKTSVPVKKEPSLPNVRRLSIDDKEVVEPSVMWVEKYKPVDMKKIVGQHGGASCASKLVTWLKDWQKFQACPKDMRPKPKFTSRGMVDPTGASFRAALLSGPPGIGKTTSAKLACESLGMKAIEFNASDTRNKKSLASVVRGVIENHSAVQIYSANNNNQKIRHGKGVLIMDEVDGMAGNEDRGGVAELIALIKSSAIPIICICNDRNHQKIRSLANHTFDLRFPKPRVEQITGAMMSICFKEGFKIAAPAVQEVIRSCNQDIRQTINTLNMMAVNKTNDKKIEYDDAKSDDVRKDLKIGPFDALRMIFQKDRSKPQPDVIGKHHLFFQDYSLMGKFVFENYLSIQPMNCSSPREHLRLAAKCADSLSMSSIAEKDIMAKQAWGLLPTVATLSTVIPGTLLSGSMNKMIDFPKELGKISSTNKMARIADQLKFHTSLSSKCDRHGLVTAHAPTLRENLTRPLIRQSKGELEDGEGVLQVLNFLQEYSLTKDDMDCLFELTQWPRMSEPLKGVDSKVKASLTRAYNKSNIGTPYATEQKTKKKKKKPEGEEDGSDGSDPESDNDVSALMKKPKAKKAATKKKTTATKKSTKK